MGIYIVNLTFSCDQAEHLGPGPLVKASISQRSLVTPYPMLLLNIIIAGMNQAYSLLSTTHGHITDCNLDSVVDAGICVVV